MCTAAPRCVYMTDDKGGNRTEDFEKLFRAEFPTVARSLGLVVGNREDGIELAQEAFARAWGRWDRYQSAEHVRNSVIRIGVNLARSEMRRRKSLSNTRIEALRDDGHSFEGDDTTTRLVIVDALRELSDRQRICIVLTDYAGMDSREVGRVLRIPSGSVRTHVTRARRRLRVLLDDGDEEGHTDERS